ncbi:MAG: glycoside hydrolase family 88 protein, partial [Acidobacteriia bacterium]|nr:glycoside hydrolase family 88 protein [Terriglobia bacterium]
EPLSNGNPVDVMKQVADWQLENPEPFDLRVEINRFLRWNYDSPRTDWTYGTFYAGVMALYAVSHDEKYFRAADQWAQHNDWKPGPGPFSADDHCVGQAYLDLYRIRKDPQLLRPIQHTFDQIISDAGLRRDDWSWSDALFMDPPVLAGLSRATGDRRYLDFMDTRWWQAVDSLYDSDEHLFFHDQSFRTNRDGSGPREANGKKIFWNRGNGWVLAGLIRVLRLMPADFKDRQKYEALFRETAKSVKALQGDDGLWRPSLLDPITYSYSESSGSALFCYALAAGMNEGLLERTEYLPVVRKSWNGLLRCVQRSGRLGWVGGEPNHPGNFSADDTGRYGVGAFLLAGSEVVRLQQSVRN